MIYLNQKKGKEAKRLKVEIMFELWCEDYNDCTIVEKFDTLEKALDALRECPEDINGWVEDLEGTIFTL